MSLDWEKVAKAELHAIRVDVLEALVRGKRSPTQVVNETGEPLGNVSYHMRVLREKGLIEIVETVPHRGAVEHIHALTAKAKK